MTNEEFQSRIDKVQGLHDRYKKGMEEKGEDRNPFVVGVLKGMTRAISILKEENEKIR